MVEENPLIMLHEDWATAIDGVEHALASAGFEVIPSFDLQVAQAEAGSFICPVHGSAQCDAQMVVLLVYDRDNPPLTLEFFGHENLTSFTIVDTSELRPDPHLAIMILQILTEVSKSKRNLEVVSNGR